MSVDATGKGLTGLAALDWRFVPALQTAANANGRYYRSADSIQYHFGRAGGAGSLNVELDFSGAGELSDPVRAAVRRAAKLEYIDGSTATARGPGPQKTAIARYTVQW